MSEYMIIKSPEEIKIMQEGGAKLAHVRDSLQKAVKVGVSAYDIEELANDLIKKTGGTASFKMVPGYSWATCVNVNEGVVHGIPKKDIIFKKGDVVSVDVGLFYKGFHTDTSFSVGLDVSQKIDTFLKVGQKALKKAIAEAKPGNKVSDISRQMQTTVEGAGYYPMNSLVGHGVGRNLHEDPQIPCFVPRFGFPNPKLKEGLVIAIEIMYSFGTSDVVVSDDQWTIVTHDGTISALYEETVAVTKNGPKILTKANDH